MSSYDSQYNDGLITNVNNRKLFNQLKGYIDNSEGTIFIIVPFISNNVLEELLSHISGREVCVVTSWRADHLISGVSSLDLYELCSKRGWTLYINSNLHCKIYSDSFNSCVITSANCTARALKNEEGNIESCVMIRELNVGNRVELNRIVYSSTCVDEALYKQYLQWYERIDKKTNNYLKEPDIVDISPYYISQLPATKNIESLWEYVNHPELFVESINQIEHDLAIYSTNPFGFSTRDEFFDNIRSNFNKHPFIKFLEEHITERGINFGRFKTLVQRKCSDTPLPFKKDLTQLTRNLYQWFVELFPDTYGWYVPGSHSQVLYRKGEGPDNY